MAANNGLPRENVWLGGDHLGPNAWQDRPAEAAMILAEQMIAEAVWRMAAGESPVYVIGTEVPVLGGAQETLHDVPPTTTQAAAATLAGRIATLGTKPG